MLNFFKKHLEDSNTTYLEHFTFAIYASFLLSIAAVTSLIHAVFPFMFKGTAAYIVIKLYKSRLEHHSNPVYQEWVKNGVDKSRDNKS